MTLGTRISRRAMIAFVAVLGFSLLGGTAAQAKKKKPVNVVHDYQGTLAAEGFQPIPFLLSITSEKKNGKFEGVATTPGQDPVQLSGKVRSNLKITGSYDVLINEIPSVVTLKGKVARDGLSAEGTFVIKTVEGEQALVTGTFEMEAVPDKG
jgi:hypothetical protein